MGFLDRIKKRLTKVGEQFTVTNGGTYRGVFRMLDTSTMRTYLDDADVMGVTHPGLLLITHGDATIEPNNTITRDGRIYTVLKTSQHRIGSMTVVKIALLA